MTTTIRWILTALMVGYIGLAYYGTLEPFNFSLDARQHAGTLAEPEWIPFTWVCPIHGYEFNPKNKLLNLLMFIPFGLMLGAALPDEMTPRKRLWWVAGVSFGISLSIEISQYFLPSRLPSASDLLLNTVSGALGVWFLVGLWPRYQKMISWF